jgi:hypothetical protein
MKRIAWTIVMGVIAVATAADAGTWYVATNATHTYDGSSWDAAFTNVQDALGAAASNDTIYVAGHTFGLTTQLVWTTSYLTVRGGYAATNAADQPGPSDTTRWPTVIQRASGNTRILHVNGVTNGTLDHVTIAGGNVDTGAGLRIDASSNFLLSGSVVESNAISAVNAYGAGIYVAADSAATVSNCVIRNNTGDNSGGGYRYAAGGGIYTLGILTLRDSAIVKNSITVNGWSGGGYGGGIYVGAGRLTANNALINGNSASHSGYGVQVSGGTANMRNCTIVNHLGESLRRDSGTLGVTNCIFWQNTTDTNGAMTVSYSLIGSDPKFEYGYYLGAGSPATNAGSDTAANLGLQTYAKNAAGAAYGAGEIVNMGYHYKTGFDMTYADIYVAPESLGGNDGNNGTNAATPFKTMTKALAMATDSTRIHVAAGIYSTNTSETFPLTLSGKAGVQILGTNAALTVFDAVGSGARVMSLSVAHSTLLDGLTLKRGGANGGAGLRIENSLGIVLSGCVVESNTCSETSAYAAGIYAAADTSVTVSNCMVRGNTANAPGSGTLSAYGGGIYSLGTLTLRDSVIVQNASTGAGAWTGGGFGGGLYFSGARLDLRNVLVAGNNASHTGDGLYAAAGTVTLTNVTVAGNSGEGLRRTAGTVSVKDSILWGNGVDSTGTVTISWSCISNSTDYVDGGSNITVNPLFVDTTYYHLQSRAGHYAGGYFSGGTWTKSASNSPCIDAGDPTSDYSREPQPNGRRVNMGCYGNTPVASLNADPRGKVFMIR